MRVLVGRHRCAAIILSDFHYTGTLFRYYYNGKSGPKCVVMKVHGPKRQFCRNNHYLMHSDFAASRYEFVLPSSSGILNVTRARISIGYNRWWIQYGSKAPWLREISVYLTVSPHQSELIYR